MAANDARLRTALVLAGGGSFGAIQVGMLHSLATHGIAADMVVGSSVGSLNGAYYAGNPTLEGVERLEAIWRALRRSDVFPVNWAAMLGFLVRRNFLVEPDGLRMLIESNLTYRNLEDAKIPIHIVATDILTGGTVVLSEGSAAQAIIASAAIPAVFPPVRFEEVYLVDGAVSSNTAVKVAVDAGSPASHYTTHGLRLRALEAAGRRGGKRAACAHVTDRPANAERIEGARWRQHRIFRSAAALPAHRVTV